MTVFDLYSMNKLTVFIAVILATIQLSYFNLKCQEQNEEYYWFSLKLGKSNDKNMKRYKFSILKMSKKYKHGAIEDFILYCKNEKIKNEVIIGPFSDRNQILQSIELYKTAKNSKINPKLAFEPNSRDSVYYFYFINYTFCKHNRHLGPTYRKIESIISGSLSDFEDFLFECLYMNQFIIGPFHDYEMAEKSKSIVENYNKND